MMVLALSKSSFLGVPPKKRRAFSIPEHNAAESSRRGENDITCPAPIQRCNECQQWIRATSDVGEFHLHLFTRLDFEPNDGFSSLGFQPQQEAGEDRISAFVTCSRISLSSTGRAVSTRWRRKASKGASLPTRCARAIDDRLVLGLKFEVASNGISRAAHLEMRWPE
jgi:hypothetical protein